MVAQSVHSKYSDVRYPRPVSHPDTEMHVPPFDPICKAVHELSSNTAARSLSPDVQVARLAVALLVQCFAIGHEEEGRATSNDGQKDAGPATKERHCDVVLKRVGWLIWMGWKHVEMQSSCLTRMAIGNAR